MNNDNAKTDAAVLDGSPVEVTFDGKIYLVRQHPRRIQRVAREKLLNIATGIASIESATDADKISACLRTVNLVIDFIEDYCPDMARDIDAIEQRVMNNGFEAVSDLIEGVYTPLFDSWLKPWMTNSGEPGE